MYLKRIVFAAIIVPSATLGQTIISQTEFDRCIRPAVTDTSSISNFKIDFSLVPQNCATIIHKYGKGVGDNPTSRALIELTKEAITNGLVPKSDVIVVQDIGVTEASRQREDVIGTPVVIFEDDDIQILVIKKR